LSHTPSLLRRAGAALAVCIVLGGVLSGCALRKTGPSPSPSASFNPHFAKSTELAANLKALGPVSGDLQGTMSIGNDKLALSGSVTLNDTASRIRFVESAKTSLIFVETVVGGSRYTSHDDKIWANRGAKRKGEDLATLLANADTSVDAGVGAINKISAHKIMTAPDKMDVAVALGLDTWTFDQETTTLRVWASDAGKVLGFGASMSWKMFQGSDLLDVTADFDVMFLSTTPVSITAPAKPWTWVENGPMGIAFAYPAENSTADNAVRYSVDTAGSTTLADAISQGQNAVAGFAGGTNSTVVDSEDAMWFITSSSFNSKWIHVTVTAANHLAVLMVIHEKLLYTIVVIGNPKGQLSLDVMAVQMFSTIEFTR
jgi:hypothetical protein